MPAKGDVKVGFGKTSGTIQAGVLGTADIANLAVTTAKLAADAVTGAKIADDAVDSEHYAALSIDTEHLSADCVTGAKIADDAVDSEHYAGLSIDTEHIAAGQVTEAKVAANSLTGTVVANVAESNVIGGIPVLHVIPVAGGAAGNVDVTITHRERVIDVWAVHTGGAGEANDTLQVKSAANAITDAMSWAGADAAVVRAASIDDAQHEIAAGGTLRVTTTDDDAGGDVGAGIVYVLAMRIVTP